MKKAKKKSIFIVASTLFVLTANRCTKAEIPKEEPVVVTQTVTYEADIKTIVQNSCLTCHGAVNPAAGLNLSTYLLVKDATQNGSLIQRINDASSPMPQSGLLPAEQRALFDKWVQDGYLEN